MKLIESDHLIQIIKNQEQVILFMKQNLKEPKVINSKLSIKYNIKILNEYF